MDIGANMGYASRIVNQISVLPKRREARLPTSMEVRVLGIDADGKAFHQAAKTIDIRGKDHRIEG
jgi:hypothetical protein